MILIKLYSLEPIGAGTANVESLTSYLVRLAEAHCVALETLIGQAVNKELEKNYHIEYSKKGGRWFSEHGAGYNGLGKQAEDLSSALFNLTRCDVSALTLLSWRDVFPSTGILRKNKAWCPICLEGWRKNRLPVYEPLIWSFKAVKICGVHDLYLNTRCPLCNSEIPTMSRKSINGYCPFCNCWLGSQNLTYSAKEPDLSEWNHFVINNIGDLLTNEVHLTTDSIVNFIDRLIKTVGGLSSLSRCINISKSALSEWHNGTHRPSLNQMLRICYHMGVNILSVNSIQQFNMSSNRPENLPSKPKMTRRKIDWTYVKSTLVDIINNTAATSSVQEVARELNIDRGVLYKHLPLLCKEISKKNASYIQARKTARIQKGCDEVRMAVMAAINAGLVPSRRNIEQLLPAPINLRNKTYNELWKSLMYPNNKIE